MTEPAKRPRKRALARRKRPPSRATQQRAYQRALKRYERELAAWQAEDQRQTARERLVIMGTFAGWAVGWWWLARSGGMRGAAAWMLSGWVVLGVGALVQQAGAIGVAVGDLLRRWGAK